MMSSSPLLTRTLTLTLTPPQLLRTLDATKHGGPQEDVVLRKEIGYPLSASVSQIKELEDDTIVSL